ncbi:non-ribosomal peptide synthetase [Aquiflexum lacus]|uniref:non-ribosomal peptide synthetase n=1 Tax=Aquiflexum lacus TaxID=2483805 RepID=UPI001895421C|nr:non-ribosomal peptide synthetase [Aquiflexum lacus]
MSTLKSPNDLLSKKDSGKSIKYWKSKLQGIETLQLPKDPFGPLDGNGNFLKVHLPKDSISIEHLKNSFDESTILFTLIGSLQVLLYRYSNQNDFCIGLSLEDLNLKELSENNGLKIDLSPLPIRSQLDSNISFDSIIQNTRNTIFEALENSNITVEELINVSKNGQINDLFFNVLCVFKKEQDIEVNNQISNQDSTDLKDLNAILVFEFEESDQYLNGSISYRSDMYGEAFINRMIEHFLQLLDSIRLSPNSKVDELNILSQKEKSFILEKLNDTATPIDESFTILDLFENQVNQTPDAIALEFEGIQLTYSQLDKKSNQLAHYLKSIGLNSEDPVPICLDRSLEMVIAIFGIFKAGGAYVPIDPFFPADRIDYMVEDTGANIVICSNETSKNFGDNTNRLILDRGLEVISKMPTEKVFPSPSPENLVYIIYTSGSTGKPKGAMVEHRNLINFVNSLSKIVEYDSSSIQLSVTTYIFDAFCLELFVPLAVGAKVILVSKEVSMDGFKLAKELTKHKPTHMQATASGWQLLLNAGWNNPEGIIMTTGGEAIGEEAKNMLARTGKLWNLYGPTETTITSAFKKLEVHEKVTIGKPIDNTQVYILGPGGSLNPLGIPGELCISGKGVGRGYLNRPELTVQKFVPDPFSDEKDAVMYHTGDLARWLPDGNIEYLGRLDDQVKIRGYRIELGEIESILQLHPSIKQAVVLAKESAFGDKRLIGYVVCNGHFDRNAVITFLQSKLPEYMIPSLWMELENLPLAFSGKVDKKALAAIEIEHVPSETYEAPKTELENQIAKIWQKTLGLERIGVQDNFFVLGGHSLLAMKVIATIRSEMGIELSIQEIFNFPTIRQLAEILSSKSSEENDLMLLGNSERPETIPLSYNQQSLWFIHQLEGSTQYHIPLVFRIDGSLNKKALKNALVEIVNRHEILRTVISEKDGIESQKILDKNLFDLQFKEITDFELEKKIDNYIKIPFDLNKDLMIRACLNNLSNKDHVLIIVFHHIAFDGSSALTFKKELWEFYSTHSKGLTPNLAKLPFQYTDYALWQRQFISQDLSERKLKYWERRLQGTDPLQLPTDFSRPAVLSSKGDLLRFSIEQELIDKVYAIGLSQNATLFMTLLTTFNVLLHRYSQQEDICVGTPVVGRELQEFEDMIGFFVNSIPIRNQFTGNISFHKLLDLVRSNTIDAFDHSQIPFELIVESLEIKRDLSRNPVFQVLFALHSASDTSFQSENTKWSSLNYNHSFSRFDFALELTETDNGLDGMVEYSTDLFAKETIERMIGHYKTLLHSISDNPSKRVDKLKMISLEEDDFVLRKFNNTKSDYPKSETVVSLFEEAAKHSPNKLAVVAGGQSINYKELDQRSNQFANYLIFKGVKSENPVPLCMDRSIEMVIGILGILKAGGALVPIDPSLPIERIDYMLEDTGADFVICISSTSDKVANHKKLFLDQQWGEINSMSSNKPLPSPNPENLFDIIYTSGSTGKPKGVMVEHRNLVNFLFSMSKDVDFNPSSSILSVTTYSFDIFYLELFLPLFQGACVFLADKETTLDGYRLAREIEEKAPTHMQATPSGWQLLLESGWKNPTGIKMLVGGEALKEDTKNALSSLGTLWNLYGPTETTIWSSLKKMDPTQKVNIGKPIANTSIYIFGSGDQPNPIGIPGELCIGGDGVGRGYLNRPELTSEKFVSDPFSENKEARFYRTGDLAKWLPDGNIEYLGRIDDQVKIRGHRIELEEIETVLQQHRGIKQAVVAVKQDNFGINRLIGYVICKSPFDKDEVISFLSAKLPDYMVPHTWMELDAFPLTFNGKINRKALPEPVLESSESIKYEAPKTELQKIVTEVWCKILGVEKVGLNDDFFELGGHSLMAMRVIVALRQATGQVLSIRDLFSNPTVKQLTETLSTKEIDEKEFGLKILNERQETLPLSHNQLSLWFIHQLEGSIQYHIPVIFNIKGKLNNRALEHALKEIVNRHEILRTVISEKDGIEFQKILEKNQFQLDKKEVSNKEIDNEITKLVRLPFDLNNDHMIRVCLIALGTDKYCLVITMHHIASDGWSASLLKKELKELYRAFSNENSPDLPELHHQYADYALWQRNLIAQDSFQSKIDLWKKRLQDTTPLQLPTDYTRPSILSTKGEIHRFKLDSTVVNQLKELGKGQKATLFMTLLAAYKILLYRYSGQEDICVGTPIAGRENKETEDLIGFFVNTLALRTQIQNSLRFDEFLDRVKTTTLEAFDIQQVPFETIVGNLGQERDLSRNPIFQVLFVLQNVPDAKFEIEGAEVSEKPFENFTSKFDMTFELTETNEGIEGVLEYCTDLFKKETITNFVSHYRQFLHAICNNPTEKIGKLEIIQIEEVNKILESFNRIQKPIPENTTILDLFKIQVKKKPDATAVFFEDKKLSYSDLDKKSDQLANFLIAKGIKNEALIPICLDRSFEMIIGILGILKAGGAYVPIDPTYPENRVNFTLADSGAKILLTTSDLSAKFPDSIDTICLDTAKVEFENNSFDFEKTEISPNDLAYVIYTSGSTGTPKGVLIEHKGLLASTLARNSYYDNTGSVLMIPSFAFDSSIAVIFGALTSGEQLILCKSELIKSPHHIQELLKDTETILCVPSYYRFLQEEDLLSDSHLLNVILAGENLDQSLVKLHFDKTKNVRLYNEYGPTEGTVWASVAEIHSPQEKVTIGKPIDHTRIFILNKENQLNPINVPGELCISGQGVARGYLNNPELTSEKFVKNPFDKTEKEKMYRTGDLARWLPDGSIEYLGRIDDQVKIRGYRIELGEVESIINKLNGVKESAVILREDIPGQKMLVGYVVLKKSSESEFNTQKPSLLKKELRSILPEYMVPSNIMILESLPLTSNNKIDRKKLPKPKELKISQIGPSTEIEKLISKIWCESLKKEKIDINADFFEFGGHSLLAVKVLSLLEKELDQKIPLNVIFKYPRIVDLAEYIEYESIHDTSENYLVPIKPNGAKPPLFIIHGVGSTNSIYYTLAKFIENDQPIYGFQPKGLDGVEVPNQSVEEMAAYYISLMIRQYPSGPYCIAGYSFGGYVAFEMARHLKAMGREVSKLILFDTSAYEDPEKLTVLKKIKLEVGKRLVNLAFAFKEPWGFYEQKSRSFGRKKDLLLIKLNLKAKPETQKDHGSIIKVVAKNNVKILKQYKLNPYKGDLHLFKVKNMSFYVEDTKYYGWAPLVNKVHNVHVSGHHDNIFKKPEILKEMAEKIQLVLDEKSFEDSTLAMDQNL